ncbi:MAG: hypothetical protein ACR2J8_16065, partial [Thermomicrobiales bacterium]
MKSSARLLGIVLLVTGIAVAIFGFLWLKSLAAEGAQQASGITLGAAFFGLVLVLPLVGFGLFFFVKGGEEVKRAEAMASQRK